MIDLLLVPVRGLQRGWRLPIKNRYVEQRMFKNLTILKSFKGKVAESNYTIFPIVKIVAAPVAFAGGPLSTGGRRLPSGSNTVRQWILQQEAISGCSDSGGVSGSGPASLPLYTRSLPRPARGSRAGWYRSQAVRGPAQDNKVINDVFYSSIFLFSVFHYIQRGEWNWIF